MQNEAIILFWWLMFGGSHVIGSSIPVRSFVISRTGKLGFKVIYSVVALAWRNNRSAAGPGDSKPHNHNSGVDRQDRPQRVWYSAGYAPSAELCLCTLRAGASACKPVWRGLGIFWWFYRLWNCKRHASGQALPSYRFRRAKSVFGRHLSHTLCCNNKRKTATGTR